MKYFYTALILTLLLTFSLQAQDSQSHWREMRYLSEEEMLLPLNVEDFYETDPPVGDARNVAEFDQMQAIIVRYPFGVPVSLIKELADDIEVLTLVANGSEQQFVTNQYSTNGVNLDNCSFLQIPTDSYWVRDYGPWFIFDGNNQPGIVNFPYNRPRPNDDNVPIEIANYLDIDLYGMNLISTGGNYMTDGLGKSSSTELVYEENPTLSEEDVDALVFSYLNIENYYIIDDPLDEYIKHIDCWGKFLSPGKVLIGQVSESDYRYEDFEAAANFFKTTTSSWGKPYEVFRVFTPGTPPNTPYTNSLIANKKVLVPLTGSIWDDEAIDAYEEAMPGYEIVGINYTGWLNTDALHCRAKGIADLGMLYIDHTPLLGNVGHQWDYELTAEIIAYSDEAVYPDSVFIYYSVDGGDFVASLMENESGTTWTGTINNINPGDKVDYYIYAADESGRNATHPFIGEPDPHEFSVFGMPADELSVEPDSLFYLTFEECYEGKELHIINMSNDPVDIIYIPSEPDEIDGFFWTVEDLPEFPYSLATDDTLSINIMIMIPVNMMGELLFDTLDVTTDGDTYHSILAVDSDLVSDMVETPATEEVKVFPNPVTNQANFSFALTEEREVSLLIFDLNGRLVFEQENVLKAGKQSITWSPSQDLKAGYYFYKLQLGERMESGKVIFNR